MTERQFLDLGSFIPAAGLWTRLQRNVARLEEEKYYPQNVFQRERRFERWPEEVNERGYTDGSSEQQLSSHGLCWMRMEADRGRLPSQRHEQGALLEATHHG